MAKKIIKLSKQEDLKVFMSPQRQKLLRLMRITGDAVTSKAIADMLEISASSAQFHIKKLEKLGIVELDHTEIINGILAKYYRLADVDISIGTHMEGDSSKERYIIMQNLIKDTFDGLIAYYEKGVSDEEIAGNSEFLNGVLHLSENDAQEFLEMIRKFIDTHEQKATDTTPWEYAFMIYNTGG